ncbi:FMN-dependent NADH-azoreductase [Algoriphagus sp. NG3]|uniref:FMN-dependent NADH-azoreductase n=1 Tax=unclassified Algoriphagus TaxID=2641541 RepID=UPI002A813D3C|nr:NAD(P)H-dependent oxidoreductase [Algoriphagus sp. NG3]WPR77265.1 NAD(P)H-dependent oxidoreductase [Algoriphagus sp. NG3]
MKILHLITSTRGDDSVSNRLGNAIIEKLKDQFPVAEVKKKNLAKSPLPHLGEVHLTSFFTPEKDRTPQLAQAVLHSDEAISELNEADLVVIDVPMYNFSIPSTLKSWIDHIARAGITFRYTESGVEGLVKNKKVYLAIASGGIYSEGSMKEFDFTESYLRNILGFIGINDVTVFRAEGLAIPEIKEMAIPKALRLVEDFAF